ncbi:hypothetical protein V6N13_060510 [Hibiscus sabdariffa]
MVCTVASMGIGVLNQYSSSLNYMNPVTNSNLIAKALIGCIQMVPKAVRLRNIQQRVQLALAAARADGSFGVFYPDGLMLLIQHLFYVKSMDKPLK